MGGDGIIEMGLMFFALLALILLGLRVGVALGIVSLAALWLLLGDPLLDGAGLAFWRSINSFSLTAIPLYVLMGELLLRGKFVEDVYRLATLALRRIPGGAAYGTVVSSLMFASMSGSSVANAATMGTVAGDAMTKMGYHRRLTFGSIAAGGTLGILMPPSTVMIMYGGMTGVSIGALFMAGLIPAILGALLFCAVIFLTSVFWYKREGSSETVDIMGGHSLARTVASVVTLLVLIGFVLGGIYVGWFSPTESAGIGASAALLLGTVTRRLARRDLWDALGATTSLTGAVLFIIGSAGILTFTLKYLGYTASMASAVADSGLPTGVIVVLVCLFYLVMGLFIESTSLIVMTVPVVYPILDALGVDGVWFGVLAVILIEIGLITPPVGLNLFVLQRVKAGQTFGDIAIGSAPYVGALMLLALMIGLFPEIATWLPSLAAER